MMFAFGLPGIISAFFADRPLLLYAAAPISSLQLYVARLVQATLPAGLVGVVLLAVVFGYGVAAHLSPALGLLPIVLVVALALTLVSLSLCLMCLVLRVVPATRARDVAGVVLALIGSSFSLVQFVLRGPLQVAKQDPHQLLRQVTALGDRLAWLPTSWPAEALSAWAVNSPLRAVGWTALSLALGALTVAAGWFLYQQTLVLGLGVFGEARAGSSRRRRSRPQPAAARRPGTAHPVTAIAAKDPIALRPALPRLA